MKKLHRWEIIQQHLIKHGSDISSIDDLVQKQLNSNNATWIIIHIITVLIFIGIITANH